MTRLPSPSGKEILAALQRGGFALTHVRELGLLSSLSEQPPTQENKNPVIELFFEGKISAGKAAELLDLSKSQFIELLNERNLPYLDADREELEREVAAARAGSKPSRL